MIHYRFLFLPKKTALMTDKKETEAFKGLDDDERADLQLESQDKTIFTIPRKAAFMSALIKTVATGGIPPKPLPVHLSPHALDKPMPVYDDYHVYERILMDSFFVHTPVFFCADTEEDVIPLPNVTSSVLKEVVAFLIYHEGKPSVEIARPLTSATLEEVVSDPWDAHFVDVSQERLFELILVRYQSSCIPSGVGGVDLCYSVSIKTEPFPTSGALIPDLIPPFSSF